MLKPFPLVIVSAIGLLAFKLTSLLTGDVRVAHTNGIDPMPVGSISRPSQSMPQPQIQEDDIFIKALLSLPAKEAARIFSGLSGELQVELAPKMTTTLLADILSQMPLDKTEKFAQALAAKSQENYRYKK